MARTLFLFILWLALVLSGTPVLAQDTTAVGPATTLPPPTVAAAPPVTLGDAVRGMTRPHQAHKGDTLLRWVRQRAEKHLKITVR